MKIMFVSDIHGSLESAEIAINLYKEEKPNLLALLGDILYHGPRNVMPEDYHPKGVADLLNPYKNEIFAVRGNCDSEVDQLVLDFPCRSDSGIIFANGIKFFLTHGHIYSPENLPPLSDGSVFAFGHIHLPLCEKRGSVTIFNPGSIALPKKDNPKSYGIYEDGKLKVISIDGEILCESVI